MTCSHCHTDHEPDMRDWPCSWNPERREHFIKKLIPLGVTPVFIPSMASEVEKITNAGVYIAVEDDLIAYLTESNRIAEKIGKLDETRSRWLAWSRKITRPLTIRVSDTRVSTCWKLTLLGIIGLPMLILTAPIRLPFAAVKWWIGRKLCPYFTDWLRKHGLRK
jgi:hypothetical protein